MTATDTSKRRAPTIFDVAGKAGVSHQTVSRVINADPTVRPHIRERVTDAIKELGYRPRAAARALAGGRSKALGIITSGEALYGPSSTAIGLERAARAAGYHVLLASLPEPDVAGLRTAADGLLAQDAAALVLIAADNRVLDALDTLPVPLPVPVVVANGLQRVADGTQRAQVAVAIDQSLGGELAVRHLLERGHRRIAHLAGPSLSQEATARRESYLRIMAEEGLEPMVLEGDWTPACGYEAARLIDPAAIDAIFCGNDQMALGVLHAFAERGIRVPQDVAVVGYDDLPEAAHFTPPLTTVRQDFSRLGASVLDAVRDALEQGEATAGDVRLTPELVVRSST